jgi:NADPH-dependent ferric siderophore reductase
MASTKGLLLSAVGRLVLRHARVTEVAPLSAHLRRIELAGDELRGVAWTAGDKVQVLLPSRDVRTYTPIRWDRERGTTTIVVHDHGDSPGAVWGRTVAAGDACGFVGPQRSLARTRGRPAILFGDETSIGVAHALRAAAHGAPLVCVLEVGPGDQLEPALAALELADAILVPRRPTDAHLPDVAAHIRTAQCAPPARRTAARARRTGPSASPASTDRVVRGSVRLAPVEARALHR